MWAFPSDEWTMEEYRQNLKILRCLTINYTEFYNELS